MTNKQRKRHYQEEMKKSKHENTQNNLRPKKGIKAKKQKKKPERNDE